MFLEHFATAHAEARRGQRVEHFIGEQHALPVVLGRAVDPDRARSEFGGQVLQMFALTFAQIGARFEHRIARGQRVQCGEFAQTVGCERTAAAAEFEHLRRRPDSTQRRRERARDAACEHAAEFRRRHEIAGCAELRLAGAVVTEPRRIHRELHEARERQRTICRDFIANEAGQRFAVLALGRRRFRQIDAQGWISRLGCAAIAGPQA